MASIGRSQAAVDSGGQVRVMPPDRRRLIALALPLAVPVAVAGFAPPTVAADATHPVPSL